MASYNQEFCSQLIADGFAFFFFFDNTSLLEGLELLGSLLIAGIGIQVKKYSYCHSNI